MAPLTSISATTRSAPYRVVDNRSAESWLEGELGRRWRQEVGSGRASCANLLEGLVHLPWLARVDVFLLILLLGGDEALALLLCAVLSLPPDLVLCDLDTLDARRLP